MGESRSRVKFGWRVVAVHVSTYMVIGALASALIEYATWWDAGSLGYLRSMDSIWVIAAPALQLVRALLFAVVLYPLRDRLLAQPRGWPVLWGLLVVLGLLGSYVAGPGSFEGAIYTTLPLDLQLLMLGLALVQTLVFSLCLVGWYRRPHPAWGWVFGVLVVLTLALSGGGALALLLT